MDILLIIPFILLLLSMAVFPFVFGNWWKKNYAYIPFITSLIVIIYYSMFTNGSNKILLTLEDYFGFICLLFSLYVVSGGIFFRIQGKATPLNNTVILALGSVLSNLLGTTGAAILLIKPFIESNKYRLKSFHIVFFIFLICNIGGSLTPVGPPLLLGYLKGIPFYWSIQHLFLYWLLGVVYLLTVFFILDYLSYNKLRDSMKTEIEKKGEEIQANGFINVIPLLLIIGSLFITKPLFVREAVMLSCAFISYKFTPADIYKRNSFNLKPIKEVAILFAGIFITMIPAVDYLSANASTLGLIHPGGFYWATGMATSVLDNAPAYLNFLSASMGLNNLSINNTLDVISFLEKHSEYVISISVSSVFFGAMTYIGNGPNLLVKSITEHKGIKLPGFFEYIYKYALTILLPFYFVLWLLFFK